MPRFQTTDPGYRNKHGQIVISRTGFPSESFSGQTIYHLRCGYCGHDYGCNGSDIHKRRCPGGASPRSGSESFLPGSRLKLVVSYDSLGSVPLNALTLLRSPGLPSRSKPQFTPCLLRHNQGTTPPEYHLNAGGIPNNQKNFSQECV